jgi:hypothetical protein
MWPSGPRALASVPVAWCSRRTATWPPCTRPPQKSEPYVAVATPAGVRDRVCEMFTRNPPQIRIALEGEPVPDAASRGAAGGQRRHAPPVGGLRAAEDRHRRCRTTCRGGGRPGPDGGGVGGSPAQGPGHADRRGVFPQQVHGTGHQGHPGRRDGPGGDPGRSNVATGRSYPPELLPPPPCRSFS